MNCEVKSSKDIIIKLIDNRLITGEEAFILMQSVIQKDNYITTTPISIPTVWTDDKTYPYKWETTCTNASASTAE